MTDATPSPLRIGAVSFLNTVPLICGLDRDRNVVLMRDLPARLANLLYEDRIEAGLIPVVEYLRGVGGDLVPGLCIASNGPVRTVKVFSKVPLHDCGDIAVDRGSRSSVAMLRVLLAEKFDHHPDMHIVEPDPYQLFLHHDTVLVIGDRAEQVRDSDAEFVYDLGELWTEQTGLPFVYAAWVLGSQLSAPSHVSRRDAIIARLERAAERGFETRAELAEQWAARMGTESESILEYWSDFIHYRLGEAELAGLRRFAELCEKHNLSSKREAISVAES